MKRPAAIALALALLTLPFALSSSEAAKPTLKANYALRGHRLQALGRLPSAPLGAKATLEQKLGTRWKPRGSAALKAHAFAVNWTVPGRVKAGTFRVALKKGSKTLAQSRPKHLNLVPPKVQKLKPSQVLSLPSKASSTVVLSGAHRLKPGEFLAAPPEGKTPDGFLLKVLSAKVAKGKTTAKTKPASFYEAVPNGDVSAHLTDLSQLTPLNRDARLLSGAIGSAAGEKPSVKEKISKLIDCDRSAKMELSGDLQASLDPTFELHWHTFFGVPTSIDKAKAEIAAALTAEAAAAVSGEASCKLQTQTLAEPQWEGLVEIGPVPVPIHVKVPIELSAEAGVEGQIKVSAHAGVNGALGVEYHDHDISPIDRFSTDASLQPEINAQASAKAELGPDITVEAGWDVPVLGTIGADMGAGIFSGLRASYDPGVEPPGKICVPAKLTASVHFDIPVKGQIGEGPKTILDKDIKCLGFGNRWTGTIQVQMHGTKDYESGYHESETENGSFGFDGPAWTYDWQFDGVQTFDGDCHAGPSAVTKIDTSKNDQAVFPIVQLLSNGNYLVQLPPITTEADTVATYCEDSIPSRGTFNSYASSESFEIPPTPTANHLVGQVALTEQARQVGQTDVEFAYDLKHG